MVEMGSGSQGSQIQRMSKVYLRDCIRGEIRVKSVEMRIEGEERQ